MSKALTKCPDCGCPVSHHNAVIENAGIERAHCGKCGTCWKSEGDTPFIEEVRGSFPKKMAIQDYIDRGYIECPECGTQRGVDRRGQVLSCGKCSDVFPAQRGYWNLFISLDQSVNPNV